MKSVFEPLCVKQFSVMLSLECSLITFKFCCFVWNLLNKKHFQTWKLIIQLSYSLNRSSIIVCSIFVPLSCSIISLLKTLCLIQTKQKEVLLNKWAWYFVRHRTLIHNVTVSYKVSLQLDLFHNEKYTSYFNLLLCFWDIDAHA